MEVKIDDRQAFANRHVVILLKFGPSRIHIDMGFDRRLEPFADAMGEELKSAIQTAMRGTTEKLKEQGIIKEDDQ